MSGAAYLIFGIHDALYGINASFVREISWLPELHTLATAPQDILGMFNWRSQMVPMMHLDLRFGRRFSGCNLSDRAIVLEWESTYLGIVAHEAYGVEYLTPEHLDLDAIANRQSSIDRNFIIGVAQFNDRPVICLDLAGLIREPEAIASLDNLAPELLSGSGSDFYQRCFPDATVADRATFTSRAERLKAAVTATEVSSAESVLVVQIGAEYIGLPMNLVVDVDTIDRFSLSVVPVAPHYLLGQINWRGEILPIIELGDVLQIPEVPREEIVVIKIDHISVGIAVDRIFDVFDFAQSQIEDLPISVDSRMRVYLKGVTQYSDGLMYLLKLQELIEREFLPTKV